MVRKNTQNLKQKLLKYTQKVLDFAETIFGETFTPDALVGEKTLTYTEWTDEIAQTFQAAGLSITVRAPVHESVKPAVVGSERADDPRVPGALPSHYAPTTPLRLWCREAYRRFVETATGAESVAHAVWFPPDWPQTPGETLRLPQPEADAAIAQQLYQALRTLDASGAQELWVALPEGDSPLLTAVRDRLRRAASR